MYPASISSETFHELRERAARIVEQQRATCGAVDAMLGEAADALDRSVLPVPREVYANFEERAAYRIP